MLRAQKDCESEINTISHGNIENSFKFLVTLTVDALQYKSPSGSNFLKVYQFKYRNTVVKGK